MTTSESNALALHSCSTSSFHLEQNLDHDVPITANVLHIGNRSTFWQTSVSETPVIWVSPKAVALTDVTICYVSDLQEKEISTFKHPKQVEEIHFDGIISQNNFDKLVIPLANLKLLEIHISSLEHLRLTRKIGFLTYLQLSNLESLQISSYNFNPGHAANCNIEKIINNCCVLLRKLFPNLNFLAVSLPLVRHREDQITESILKSLKTHRKTIKSLNVESTFEVQCDHIDETNLPAHPNLDLELTSLKEIQLHSFHYFSTHKTHCTTFWRKFLQTQKRLEYLQFWCGKKYFSLPTVLILHNFKHLHTIALNINPLISKFKGIKRNSVDCTAFHQCSLLKTLVLKGKPKPIEAESGNQNVGRKKSDLANFSLIPKGLEHIRLIHLGLNKIDARLIAREIPHLSVLYLEDIGEDHGLGLAIDDLAYLLGKKSLLTLDVHSGINRESFNEISNETTGGFGAVARILFKTHNPQSFRAVLGQNGEYDIEEDTDFDYNEEEVVHEHEIFHQEKQEQFENSMHEDGDVENVEQQFSDEERSDSENWNLKFNEYNRFGSVNPIKLPNEIASSPTYLNATRRQKVMQRPIQNYPTIYEETEEEKLSGSSSEDDHLDFSPPSSITRLNVKDAQTETDIDTHQHYNHPKNFGS